MRTIDLRSDTVTKPTPAMRKAMAEAEVGDDLLDGDPTVNRLQERTAELFGADASLFVPTGSMGNFVSVRAMAGPGDEVICHRQAHFLHYEVASLAALGGVQTRSLDGDNGVLDADDVATAIQPDGLWFPRTKVIAIENTHTMAGGTIYPIEAIRELNKVANDAGVKVFMDGARLFNASVATGVPVDEYFSLVDSLTFAFSKGLACPAGSMVVGDKEFINETRRLRKMLGGSMRQAGILAAACLVALDEMVDRLADDHANASKLAQGIHALDASAIDPASVHTNIIKLFPGPLGFKPQDFVDALATKGIKCVALGKDAVRMVTHLDVTTDDSQRTLETIALLKRNR